MSKKPKKEKPQKEKPLFKMTKPRARLLADLRHGARVMVTNDNRDGRRPTSYSIEGGGKYSEPMLDVFIPILINHKIITPLEDGLFSGCSQTYILS